MSSSLPVPAVHHVQGILEVDRAVEFGRLVNRYRVPCSCGYVTLRYSSPMVALRSHAGHVNGTGVSFNGGGR